MAALTEGPGLVADLKILLDHWFYVALLAGIGLGVSGALGAGLGVSNLFRDDQRLLSPKPSDSRIAIWWASPAFWTHIALALLTAVAFMTIFDAPGAAPRCAPDCVWPSDPAAAAAALTRLLGYVGGAGLLFLLAAWRDIRRPRVDGSTLPKGCVRVEFTRAVAGLGVGLALTWLAWRAAAWLATLSGAEADGVGGWLASPLAWIYLIAVAVLAVALGSRKVLPCLSLIGLLVAVVLVGALFDRLNGGWGELAALGLLGLVVAANGDRFKLRIPGFPDALYDAAAKTDPNSDAPLPGHPGKIAPVAALKAWRDRLGPDAPKPKLVVFCASGGAYRASFWTALVMDHLLAESGPGGRFPGLGHGVRLITGASGGMVAGAYYAAMAGEDGDPLSEPGGPRLARKGVRQRLEQDIETYQTSDLGQSRRIPVPRDSLTPVAQQMVRGDLPGVLWPFRRDIDRGRALDAQWITLGRSFADLAPAEADGRAPAIVFSPMLIESGAPAFFANLDLSELRRRSLGREDRETDINRESVEVFEAFPDAWDRTSLATAVRLNATFPYVSPAVSLPTVPKRRVVDAGYYDNYGVDLACAWLLTHSVRNWVLDNCSGVAVIQLRAFPTGSADEAKGRMARAFQFLTSPAEGVFRARASSQMFRNNQQLRLVRGIYNQFAKERNAREIEAAGGRAETVPESFLESFAFEASADASMSWYLPEDELRAMENLLPASAGREPGEHRAAAAEPGETVDAGRAERARRQGEKVCAELDRLAAFWNAAPAA